MVSADGHQWADSGWPAIISSARSGGWPRSYPFGVERDALALSPAGCIWDDALAHGKTVRDYGEFTGTHKAWKNTAKKGALDFLACYRDFVSGSNAIAYTCEPNVGSLRPYVATNTASWDLDVPDVFRAAQFIQELKQFEQTGELPELHHPLAAQ